jgi:hypothetical protein
MSHTPGALARRAPRCRRSKRHETGAVFVEAIVVCTMLMLTLASAIFYHRMYSAKIRTLWETRVAAWKPAEDGCASKLGIGQIFNLVSVDSCSDETCNVGGLSADSNDSPDWLAMGARTEQVSYSVAAHSLTGGGTYSMRTSNRVICNEQRQNEHGDLLSIGAYIFDAVLP